MEQRSASPCIFDSPDPEATFALAALLGRSIGAGGLAIGLVGPLGSGKTVFVKGLAEGLGVDPRVVSSPTFVIAQQYAVPDGPETLHHLDLYRLGSEAELEGIGFLDWLAPGQVLAVEWLDRFPDVLGESRLEIVFLPPPKDEARAGEPATDTGRRRLRATAFGDEAARVLRDWSERVARLVREAAASGGATDTGPGAGRGAGGGRSDAGLALALACAGLLAARAFGAPGGGDPAPGEACTRLVPIAGDTRGDERSEIGRGDPEALDAEDGLGPLRVACAEEGASVGDARAGSAASSRLDGMARLLDGGQVDPNTAPRRLLENLPGVGAGRARAIVEARAGAPFESVRALERVPGIGAKTRAKLEPYLAVGSAEDAPGEAAADSVDPEGSAG